MSPQRLCRVVCVTATSCKALTSDSNTVWQNRMLGSLGLEPFASVYSGI